MLSQRLMHFRCATILSQTYPQRLYSVQTKVLHRTLERPSHINRPLSPLQQSSLPFQSRAYAKNRNKKPFQYNPPSQSPTDRNARQTPKPIEPATIPPDSKAATATEGGIDGTELPGDVSDVSSSSAQDPHKSYVAETAEFNGHDRGQSESSRPLPDLTQGIPSTLDAELAQSAGKADTKDLNLSEDPPASEGRGGNLPRSAYISSFERRRNRFANYFYAFTLFAAVSSTLFLGRNWETEEEERKYRDAPNGWGFGLFFNRVSARLGGTLDYYNEPAFPKLLPNTDPTWERPYTLVLSLEDLLVHGEWDREHGWRMAKRPGVDYFLRYLSQYYELVIFTSVPSMIGQPIINKLDPYHIVMWPLFREATRYKKGEYIKDLSYLNRPLNKIIMLDTNPAHAKLQPENAIITKKWTGDTKDKELVSFIPFLEYVASMEFNDTRDVLKSFEGTHIPSEFAKREAVAREKFMQQLAAEKAKGRGGRSMSGLGSLLGFKAHGASVDGMEQSLSEGFSRGKTFQDQVRERGQKQYEMLEKEIRENGEKWLTEMAAEEKKMNEEAMKGMKNSITGVFPFGLPGEKPPSEPSISSTS